MPIKLPDYLSFYNNNTRKLRSTHLDRLSLISSVRPEISAIYNNDSVEGADFQTFKNCFFYRSHLAWNKLPFDIRELEAPSLFRLRLRKHLWGEVLCLALNEYKEINLPPNFKLLLEQYANGVDKGGS